MTARARELLDELLRLSAEDRALVAVELEASLESGTSPEQIERLWAQELERRAHEVRQGRSSGRDAREVLAELRADLANIKR